MRYLKKFASSADTQTALNQGVLGKPYVAIVSGVGIDYNTLSAASQSIATWEEVTENKVYTFTVNDMSPSLWENDVKIATLNNCSYYNGSETQNGNLDIYAAASSEVFTFNLVGYNSYSHQTEIIDSISDNGETERISVYQENFGGSDWSPLTITRSSNVFTFTNEQDMVMSLTTIDPTA